MIKKNRWVLSVILLGALLVTVAKYAQAIDDHLVYVSVALQILIGALGIIVTVSDSWAKEHQRKFIGGIVGIAILLAWVQIRDAEKTDAIRKALHADVVSAVTGGDNFAWLQLRIDGDAVYPVLVNNGKYPIMDMVADVLDLDDPRLMTAPLGTYRGNQIAAQMLAPMSADMNIIPTIRLQGAERKRLTIFYYARNGHWIQNLRLRKVNGVWKQAMRITRDDIQIREFVDPGYGPLNWKLQD